MFIGRNFKPDCKNGLLANLHQGKWLQLLKIKILPHLSSSLRAEIYEYLEYLDKRGRIIRCDECIAGEPKTFTDWFNAAKEIDRYVPLHGIIVGRKLFDDIYDPNLPLIEACFPTRNNIWKDCSEIPSKNVPTEWQSYKENLEPILRYAKRATLIDPHLQPEKRFLDTIQLCCNLLGQQRNRQNRTGHIDIHAQYQPNPDWNSPAYMMSPEAYLAKWKIELKNLDDAERYDFSVSLWEKPPKRQELFHDRCIITNQCGIKIGYGLDLVVGNRTTWSQMTEQERQNELQKFTNAGPLKSVGEKLIILKRKIK